MSQMRQVKVLTVLVAVFCLLAAACGSDDEAGGGGGQDPGGQQPTGSETGEDQEVIQLTVGVLPIAPLAPIFLGIDQGFFEEEGLEITTQQFQGGPEVVAAAISGDIDVSYTALASVIAARAQGAPVSVTAPSDINRSLVNALVVTEDSDIEGFDDLAGRTVAVNVLQGFLHAALLQSIEDAGADPSQVDLIEVPFPQMGELLDSGQVDAVVTTEPFLSAAVAQGQRVAGNPPLEAFPDGPGGVWFATETFISDSAEALARFEAAIARSNVFAQENPDEVRRILTEFTQISADVAEQIELPTWTDEIVPETVARQVSVMLAHGMIPREVSVEDLLGS